MQNLNNDMVSGGGGDGGERMQVCDFCELRQPAEGRTGRPTPLRTQKPEMPHHTTPHAHAGRHVLEFLRVVPRLGALRGPRVDPGRLVRDDIMKSHGLRATRGRRV